MQILRLCIFLLVILASTTSINAQQRQLGTNLSWVNDYATMIIFTDIFKASRPWISHRPSDDTWDTGESFDLDENGWVRSLKPDQETGTLLLTENGNQYPAGEYLCLYDGEGEIHFEWDAQITRQEPGRIVFNVTPEIGIHLIIRSTNPDNHIRNIRVILPGFESTYEQEPFHPDYIHLLRNFSTLRFMDWGQTTENPPGEWAQRTHTQSATQASTNGVALEYMIQMANTVGAHAWFNVPHTATNEYITNMAQLIRDQLNPNLKAYIEYSNEVWNPSYPQNAYAREQGLALGLDADPYLASLRFHAQKSVEVFDIFEREFGSTDRLVRVMGAQVDTEAEASVWFAQQVLDWQNAYQKTDAYAVAPYFGYYLGTPEFANQLAAMSVETVLDSATVDMRRILASSEALIPILSERNVELITYEAGQGMVASGSQQGNTSVYEKLNTANRHPRMYDIYTEYLEAWERFGGTMVLYTDIRRYDQWSSYGLLERWDQPVSEAHKFRAVIDFFQTNTQPAPTPLLSFPSTPLNFGTINIGSTATTTFEVGNEGTDTLRISGFTIDNTMFSVEQTAFNLAPQERQNIVVSFVPTAAGDQSATLSMASNDPNVPTAQIILTGSSVQPQIGILHVATDTLNFGTLIQSTQAEKTVELTNQGNASLQVVSRISNQNFSTETNTIELNPNQSHTISVQFVAKELGPTSGVLFILSGEDTTHVSLLANVVPAPAPSISTQPLEINFGPIAVGQSAAQELAIANTGNDTLQITTVQTTSPEIAPSDTILAILPNTQHPLTITFQPQSEGLISQTLTILSNDTNMPETQITIRAAVRLITPGNPIDGPLAIDLDPTEGNQNSTIKSGVQPKDSISLEVFTKGLPEVTGVGFHLMFDPNILTFKENGFTPSTFIPNATYLSTDWGGILDIGGFALSGETGSGEGLLGQIQFEIQEGFSDSTFVAITQIGFTEKDSTLQEQRVRIVAWLKAGVSLIGDFNGDGAVGFPDFILFATAFGGTDAQFDLSGDGLVGFPDFLIFGQAFGTHN